MGDGVGALIVMREGTVRGNQYSLHLNINIPANL